FDEVFFNEKIKAVCGRRHHKNVALLHLVDQAQAGENAFDFGAIHRHAQHAATSFQAHAYRLAGGQLDDLIVQRTDLPAANVHQQARHALEMLSDGCEVDPALEAMTGFRAEFVATRLAHDGLGPPERPFQINIGGVQRDSGSFAAHDASHAFHDVAGRNNAHVGCEVHRLAIEQLQRLAFTRPAHRQTALDAAQVEHMGGSAQFKHDVVGDVDQRRYR